MSDSPKPILVFVPGLGANGEVYSLLLDELRGRYDVRSADLGEDFPERLSWPFFLESIDRAANGAKEFYLLGHSLGGALALKYAADNPARVKRLVVVAPLVFPLRPHREYVGLSRFTWYRRLRSGVMALLSGHPLHLLKVVEIRKQTLGGDKRQRLYDWIDGVDLAPEAATLKNTTVLWPRREELIDPMTYTRLKEYSNITVRTVPGSHNNLALGPRKLVPIVEEALRG
jgi:pimeloyl-ACP methyl ester carboxylesterase